MLEIKAMSREDGVEQEVVIISFESFFGEGYCLCMNENGAIFHVKNEYITITDKKYLESCAKGSIEIELAEFFKKVNKRLNRVQYQQLENIICELDDYRRKIEQGTLIELPCKVGDTIFGIYEFADEEDDWYEIYPVRVREIHIRKDDIWLEIQRPFIGKFVSEKICFTREEAEKRLKELKNG